MRSILARFDRRSFLTLGGAFCLAGVAPAYARGALPTNVVTGEAFGTDWSILLPAGAETSKLRPRVENLLHHLDLAFSPWRADGIVARFNAGSANEMKVTAEITDVTRSALRIAEASRGCFDPTVGPLVARWGFGPIHGGATFPDGWRGLVAHNDHIGRSATGLTLDLCGIAKGHALDRLTELLLDAGHEDFLINLGGEVAARGSHPSGRIWHVGIELPLPAAEGVAGVLRLDNIAVATSGDRANGYEFGQRRYSHIIDPATREPVEGRLSSVSVVSPSAREADAWATALMAAGEAGPILAASQSLAALFLIRDGSGLRRVVTGSFDQHLG